MKKIAIAIQNNVDSNYKKWAKEATDEFLQMFPEYKNSFSIEIRDDANINDKEISQAQYDALPNDSYKQKFIKSTNGKWLVPYKSLEWTLAQAKKTSTQNTPNRVDVRKVMSLQADRIENQAQDEIVVSLVKGQFNPYCYGYAYEKYGSVLAVDACRDEEFFKTIFIHELGHVFRATSKDRDNTVEINGSHCTNNLCIMGASNYDKLTEERVERKNRGQPPFCDECISSMREYMENMPELVKELQSEQFNQHLPVLPHNNDNWKNSYREFYRNVAERDGNKYLEDNKSKNYIARIKKNDGSTLEIEANNEYHVALGAKDCNGDDDIPSLDDMRDLVKLAQSKKSGMNFGKDNDAEFNGRLLIACLEAKPKPLDMSNKPIVNHEFLEQLRPETRRHLRNILNSQQNGNNATILAMQQRRGR